MEREKKRRKEKDQETPKSVGRKEEVKLVYSQFFKTLKKGFFYCLSQNQINHPMRASVAATTPTSALLPQTQGLTAELTTRIVPHGPAAVVGRFGPSAVMVEQYPL